MHCGSRDVFCRDCIALYRRCICFLVITAFAEIYHAAVLVQLQKCALEFNSQAVPTPQHVAVVDLKLHLSWMSQWLAT